MIGFERLALCEEALEPLARELASGRTVLPGLPLARSLEELEPPPDRFEPADRAALARELERELAPLSPHVAVLDALRALGVPGTSAVVTGQQPGFLASPLYSLYKALQAVRLARACSQRWERPVVALFWNHADDHDVAEVHHVHVVNPNLDLQKIALPGLSSGRVPLSRVVLDEDAQRLPTLRALLAEIHRGAPALERALQVFFPRSGESLARAFTRAMTELCGPLGLVVVEPDWIRSRASDALARIVGGDANAALVRGAEDLRSRGFEVAIEPRDAALVYRFEREEGRVVRRALRAGGDGYRYDGESGSRTNAELAAEIVQDRLDWSPGALLRPLVQDLCLPTAAYVGGWGELAYHAELAVLRRELELPPIPFVPRSSCTLVDSETRTALAKLGLALGAVLRSDGDLSALLPPATRAAAADHLRAVAEEVRARLQSLRGEIAELDPSLVAQLKRTAGGVAEQIEKLAEKAERVHDNHAGKGRRHQRRVQSLLFPRGEPQERVLGPFPFVARFGTAWIEELSAAIDPLGRSHLVIDLGSDSEPSDEESR